jgi:hypothetical protein
MASKKELSDQLLTRLKDVPNVDSEDTDAWIDRSLMEHGFDSEADVPQDQVLLVMLYAEWDACLQIAFKAAHYFEYKDSDQTVDKRNVSEQYRQIAVELRKEYDRKKAEGSGGVGGARFRVARRVDRR